MTNSIFSNAPPRRSTELVSVDLDVDGLCDGEDVEENFDAASLFGASVFIPDENEDPDGALEANDTVGSLSGRSKNLHRQHHQSSGEEDSGFGEDGNGGGGKAKKVR